MIMQFLTNVFLMVLNNVCILLQKSFVQNLVVGLICTIGGGIILYLMYAAMDKNRYHNSNWTELPSDIWYTYPWAEYPISHRKISFGEKFTPEDEQVLQRLPEKLSVYVDYPISMAPMFIVAYEQKVKFGNETVDNLLPSLDGQEWEIHRTETQNSPTGYIRERVDFIRITK